MPDEPLAGDDGAPREPPAQDLPGQDPSGQPAHDPYWSSTGGPDYPPPNPYGHYAQGPGYPGGPGYLGYPGQGYPGGPAYPAYPFGGQYVPEPERDPEQRRSRARRALALGGAVVLALGAGIGIGAWVAPTNPTTIARALVSKSISAAARAGSYHYSELSTVLGVPDDITGAAAHNGGRQVITQRCSSGTNVFDLRLVHGVVYFRGNGPAVVDQLGVPSSRASSAVDRWVKVVKSNALYKSFADGITTKSNISQLSTTIVPRTTRQDPGSASSTEILGAIFAGKGKAPIGTVTLVVNSASALPRTMSGDAVGTSGRYTLSWTFSHFGEAVHVAAPASFISYSSLHAKAPSKTACG